MNFERVTRAEYVISLSPPLTVSLVSPPKTPKPGDVKTSSAVHRDSPPLTTGVHHRHRHRHRHERGSAKTTVRLGNILRGLRSDQKLAVILAWHSILRRCALILPR